MSAATRGRLRDQQTFVAVNAILHFGWNAPDLAAAVGITSAELKTQLGHMTASEALAVSGAILVTGANAPKPARVTKTDKTAPATQVGSTSSFVAYNKVAAAAAGGWKRTKRPRSVTITAPGTGRRTFTGIVTLSNGLHYAQPVASSDATEEVRTALGIQIASQISSTELAKVARGCTSKPAKVRLANGAVLPVSHDKIDSIPEGASLIEQEFAEFTSAPPANP